MTNLERDSAGWERLRRPVWLFDPHRLRGIYANASALELWGAVTLDELLARDFSQLSPAVRARTDRLALATIDGDIVSERWTFYPKGEPVTVQAAISTYRLDDGSPVLLFEAAPAEVEAEERRAVEALRHTSSLITVLDGQDRTLFQNPAAFAAYGAPDAPALDRFVDGDAARALLTEAHAGRSANALCLMTTTSGERWHHIDVRPTTDPVTGALAVLLNEQDVTAQIEAERALVAAHERAQLAQARERFLANVSHEMRTPLAGILGFSQLMRAKATGEDADTLDQIAEDGRSLLGMVNDMILLSELDNADIRIATEPFDAAALLKTAVTHISRRAAKQGLELHLHVPAEAVHLLGDAERLGLVLRHYLDNAVKFTEAGSVTAWMQVTPTGDGRARLDMGVDDTGPGVATERVQALFERFTQSDMSTTKAVGGAGLGLAICGELIARMGGELGVEPGEREGSRFWFSVDLPIALVETPVVDEPGRCLRVLYADDHPNNRRIIQAMLASQGHACDLAEDGEEAVRLVQGAQYDLVLMDIQMPVMDGVAATRAIRALTHLAGLPILALTANTLDDQRAAYVEAGMNDCLAKPVTMLELLTKTAAWTRSVARSDRAA